jgi:hypothetical protein
MYERSCLSLPVCPLLRFHLTVRMLIFRVQYWILDRPARTEGQPNASKAEPNQEITVTQRALYIILFDNVL